MGFGADASDTEPAIQLVPIMAHLGAWGRRHLPVSRELDISAELLEAGGPELWDRFMDELRERHLDLPRPVGAESVLAYLQAACEAEVDVRPAPRTR